MLPLIGILLLFLAFSFVTILIHEVGHAVAGALAGFQVAGIEVGEAPLAQWRWRGMSFKMGIGRSGIALLHYRERLYRRWQIAVMLLGGIIANALVAGLVLARYGVSSDIPSFAGMLFCFNATAAAVNLIPFHFNRNGERLASDGYQLFNLFVRPQNHPATWIETVERSIDRPLRKQGSRCFALTTDAWRAIERDDLESARRSLREAHDLLPDGSSALKAYMQMVTASLYLEERQYDKALYLSTAATDVFAKSKASSAAAIARLLSLTALVEQGRLKDAQNLRSDMEASPAKTMPDWFQRKRDFLILRLECKAGNVAEAIALSGTWKQRGRDIGWSLAATALLTDCCSEHGSREQACRYARRVLRLLSRVIKRGATARENASIARWAVPRLHEYEQWFRTAGNTEDAVEAARLAVVLGG